MKGKAKTTTAKNTTASKNTAPAKNTTAAKKSTSKSPAKPATTKGKEKEKKTVTIKTEPVEKKEDAPKISKERLAELNEKQKKRIQQAKKEEIENRKIFEQILEENKGLGNKVSALSSTTILTSGPQQTIQVSEKKAQDILEKGGMLDAYKYLITMLCKNGLPTGNLFEYAAYVIKSYEKK